MTLIQDLDLMVIMFFICIPMDHDIVSNYIGSRVDVTKVDVHVYNTGRSTELDLV